ncbi:uncharacterized protein B0T15DRAFT_404217 [Chaetomium strumarium]|uniref:Uncharacterized protein n=1 Tax=Chaetomium strumarium TaxID=1170767 RepID=A0AAJ0LYE3_9PEZI|nr:hypothetical protein B0T15DRAFT_404217 [Chaetomium strumarium]
MSTTQLKRHGHGVRSSTPSPPRADKTPARPMNASTPVQIPVRPKSRDAAHPQKAHRSHGDRKSHSSARRLRDTHSPDAIPPSVAALLAITNIPPPKGGRSMRQTRTEKRMTVESIIERAQESEKELSLKLSKGPMDILLMAPEDLEADDTSTCGSGPGSFLSARTISLDSMPSLSNSFTTATLSSFESPRTPPRRRKIQPTRRSLEPVSSPPGELENHPLSSPEIEVDELDFRVFGSKDEAPDKKSSRLPFRPLKSAFKSNLTASLRALRQAARSFSNLNFSSIPPEDFLTRSILTIDPQVPYTDERRPPPLEEEPTAALRRYLNPTTTARLEKPQTVSSGPVLRSFTASIQMQTYKVHRPRSAPASSDRGPYPSVGPSSTPQSSESSQPKPVTEYPTPGPRQREMRENPDFIRIAVMEMAMRKSGKLSSKRPGRARWALPPRKPSTRPYVIGPDGVPARWVSVTH